MVDDLTIADLCEEEVLSSLDNCALTLSEMANVLRGVGMNGCGDICEKAAKRAHAALDPKLEAEVRATLSDSRHD